MIIDTIMSQQELEFLVDIERYTNLSMMERDIKTAAIDNFKIIDQYDNWSRRLILEAFYINKN